MIYMFGKVFVRAFPLFVPIYAHTNKFKLLCIKVQNNLAREGIYHSSDRFKGRMRKRKQALKCRGEEFIACPHRARDLSLI